MRARQGDVYPERKEVLDWLRRRIRTKGLGGLLSIWIPEKKIAWFYVSWQQWGQPRGEKSRIKRKKEVTDTKRTVMIYKGSFRVCLGDWKL